MLVNIYSIQVQAEISPQTRDGPETNFESTKDEETVLHDMEPEQLEPSIKPFRYDTYTLFYLLPVMNQGL